MKEKLMYLTARNRYANGYYCFAVYHIIDDRKTFNSSVNINHTTVMSLWITDLSVFLLHKELL